ncbi:MAG: 16S rRNA (guanine(527)-N(7))-methyltransferase RsmG [Spirochaetes bacterium]|nr:16S rRNA (guanine(527)-N(7))-methyltransferase RsmG [Spirochaetota bacterium]
MEHVLLMEWKNKTGVTIDSDKEVKLIKYAELIHETNKKFNITGFKTVEDIIKNLIVGSLDPLFSLNVPRGTLFADIGTGAGIPGVPLAIFNENWKGLCIDSNSKKISFVKSVIQKCGIENLQVHNGRLEDLARGEMRETCDYVFSRALGEIFFVLEVGAPLLKKQGLLYVYSHAAPEELSSSMCNHATEVGLTLLQRSRYTEYGFGDTGLLFFKSGATESRYPRKTAAIKRDIARLKA